MTEKEKKTKRVEATWFAVGDIKLGKGAQDLHTSRAATIEISTSSNGSRS